MGVTVQAISRTHLTEPHDREDCYGNHFLVFAHREFVQSFRGLHDDTSDPDRKRLGGRCYEATADTKRHKILSTSYGWYGCWRETLAKAVLGVEPVAVWTDFDSWRARPFFELINFADSEGCIGPEACADLLSDFQNPDHRAAYEAVAADMRDPLDTWMSVWSSWVTGLALAVDGGFVHYS